MKFKVVRESVKKTDKRDAITIAKFLEKDMLPESVLCSQKSEDIRRIIKSRSKRGPSELRIAFVQMVTGMIHYSKQTSNYIMVRYQNMKKTKR